MGIQRKKQLQSRRAMHFAVNAYFKYGNEALYALNEYLADERKEDIEEMKEFTPKIRQLSDRLLDAIIEEKEQDPEILETIEELEIEEDC